MTDGLFDQKVKIYVKKPSHNDRFHGIFIDKDRQLNVFKFDKGRHARIQLDELYTIRVVHLYFENLKTEGRTLSMGNNSIVNKDYKIKLSLMINWKKQKCRLRDKAKDLRGQKRYTAILSHLSHPVHDSAWLCTHLSVICQV